jgi:hypothetical protein
MVYDAQSPRKADHSSDVTILLERILRKLGENKDA